MDELISSSVVCALAMAGLLFAQRSWTSAERPWMWGGLLAHLCAAVAQVQIVRGVYGFGDMLSYHRTGVMVAELWRDYPADITEELLKLLFYRTDVYLPVPVAQFESSGAMVAIASILMLLVNDSLYAGCIVLALLAFVSRLGVYRVLVRELPEVPRGYLFLTIVGMPSAVFWSCGILKESVATTGLGLSILGGYGLARLGNRLSGATLFAVGMALTMLVKPYILIPFGAAAGAWVYLGGPRPNEPARRLLARSTALVLGATIAAATILGIGQVFPRFGPGTIAAEAGRMQGLVEVTSGGSDYAIGSARATTIVGQLANLPVAVATALFRPLPFEVKNASMAVSALETTALALLLLVALWRTRVLGIARLVLRSPAVTFCAIFTVGLAAGVGLGTTNLGTLSRYRAPMIPFYGVLVIAALHQSRLGSRRARRSPDWDSTALATRPSTTHSGR